MLLKIKSAHERDLVFAGTFGKRCIRSAQKNNRNCLCLLQAVIEFRLEAWLLCISKSQNYRFQVQLGSTCESYRLNCNTNQTCSLTLYTFNCISTPTHNVQPPNGPYMFQQFTSSTIQDKEKTQRKTHYSSNQCRRIWHWINRISYQHHQSQYPNKHIVLSSSLFIVTTLHCVLLTLSSVHPWIIFQLIR